MKPLFAASGWQALITLLIFVALSLISTWLNKRRDNPRPGRPTPAPGQPPPNPPSPAANWEEELRRLLEGDEPAPPPRPPPVILAEPPRRAPPPLPPAPRPVVIRPQLEPDEQDVGLSVPMPQLVESAQAHQRASQLEQKVADFMRQRTSMAQATTAYQQAQRLDEKVAEHFKHVTTHVTSHTAARKARAAAPEIAQARAMLRNRQAVRPALIASVVLGPPKAMEGY